MFIRFLIVFALVVVIELYFFQIIKTITIDFTPGKRKLVYYIAYGLAAFNIIFSAVALFYPPNEWPVFLRTLYSIAFILLICKVFGVLFLIIDDLIRVFRWIATYFQKAPADATEVTHHISRLKFMSYVGLTFTVVPAISFIYGMVKGAYKYRVHKVKVKSPNLPEAFNGFKIVQLSDIHSGSFMSTDPLVKAFGIVMEQKPDMILFTGDLVNNEAKETEPHLESYKLLKAPYGVYSSLGNHDYGDYKHDWEPGAKAANLEALKDVHARSGWRLLMNEHVPIEKDGQKIALLGIENWGGNLNFPRYGKLENAYAGTEGYPFKILLSHDPSHWDIQVSQERKYKDIDLTLSGHTHGMQFGIEIPGFIKWSPVKYIYKHWAGLYRQDNQYLYVNRGLGFLGYPGRLGIWPEITVIELERA